jgi:hypothetical protein
LDRWNNIVIGTVRLFTQAMIKQDFALRRELIKQTSYGYCTDSITLWGHGTKRWEGAVLVSTLTSHILLHRGTGGQAGDASDVCDACDAR